MNKENVVYTYSRILFSLTEEANFAHNMDERGRHYAESSKPDRTNTAMFH